VVPAGGQQGVAGALPFFEDLNRAGIDDFVPVLRDTLRFVVDPVNVRLLLSDVEERVLNVWEQSGDHSAATRWEAMEGSVHGDVYRTGRPARVQMEGHHATIAPVTARSERLGVLEVLTREPLSDRDVQAVATAGLLLGYLITAADRWTDEFHLARRRKEMDLAAEIQWNILPLAAVSVAGVSLACALEPAYEVGGDAFDYSFGRASLTAGIFDAMGRGVNAARVSALGVAAFRNGRRCHKDLAEQASFIHQSLVDRFDLDGFMTGQLLQLNLANPARSAIVNAGHPWPFLQRGNEVREVELEVDFPFGTPLENPLRSQSLELAPGDRLVLFSDGIVEARPDGGSPLGTRSVAGILRELRKFSAREAARKLIARVRAHRAAELSDDATLMILDLPTGEPAARG
jgi:Stage II sporulation protein E (SpoIIE)